MNIEIVRHTLLWCTIIDFGILALWFLLTLLFRDGLARLWSKWFHLPPEQFGAINLICYILFKSIIIVFNFVPFLALYCVG